MATKRARKRAICIGINYEGTDSELSGCINDAKDWGELLSRRGFSVDLLIETGATKSAIMRRLAEVIGNAKRGDSIVVTNSSHGTYVRDLDGDEPDQLDEAICPYDVFSAGALITDDELYSVFNDRERGVKLVFISDSCHSGTVSRFMSSMLIGRPLDAPRVRFLPPSKIRKLPKASRPPEVGVGTPPSSAMTSALLLAGCRDFEYSYDAWFGDRANGAFTRAAIDAFEGVSAMPKSSRTYLNFHRQIRKRLPTTEYPQEPQIFGTYDQRRWLAL